MHDLLETKSLAEEEILIQFQDLFSAYEKAVQSVHDLTEINFTIARQNVCLKFAGNDLAAKFTRAINHHRTDKYLEPDVTVCVWDSNSAKRSLPPFFARFIQFVNSHPNSGLRKFRGDIPLLTNHRFRAAATGDTSLTMADLTKKICVHWVSGVDQIPPHEIAAPLRTPFNFLLSGPTRQLVHGGAIGTAEGGLFLGGFGGSGKSTTALNSLSSTGLCYAGDDYVLVDLEGRPTAFNVYGTAKVKSVDDLERFPNLRAFMDVETDGIPPQKPTLFLNEHIPKRITQAVPLKSIVLPKFIAGERIRCLPMSKQIAFREVATSTVRQTPGNEQETISMIGRFIRELPCYRLTFGEDQNEIPDVLTEIVDAYR